MTKIESVKQKAILDVAASLGYSFRQLSGQVYEHPEHDSFRIFADTNTFKWFSRNIQGDVIDFVQLVANVSFKEALSFLETGDFKQAKVTENTYRPFHYYLSEEPFVQARTYLNQVRGLSDETINAFGRQGLLAQANYKTKSFKESVLVFKSFNHKGQLEGASLQGIKKNKSRYEREYLKKIMKGSHGYVGMSFDIGKPNRLIFCESVIDMMSYYQLHQNNLSDVRLVSMEGLKLSVIAYQTLRLAAEERNKINFMDTVKLNKLTQYLQIIQDTTTFFKTHPNIVTLAVDNDEAGREFCKKLLEKGLPVKQDLPVLQEKETKSDWNDVVKNYQNPSLTKIIHSAQTQLIRNKSFSHSKAVLEL
ncbi:toprim domain-containing protein [Streptococcus marimammalium]|uniref:toprim domain-containing protein n=1 Tax=Streptococcus marimammalium TaxID=269666 RepID=UPI0003720F70|nr:toprim domain-containing protein [Streptococcus marimammalium]